MRKIRFSTRESRNERSDNRVSGENFTDTRDGIRDGEIRFVTSRVSFVTSRPSLLVTM